MEYALRYPETVQSQLTKPASARDAETHLLTMPIRICATAQSISSIHPQARTVQIVLRTATFAHH
jgi:hypothetical protein